MKNSCFNFRCQKLLEGYRRLNPSKDTRMPITLDILTKIWVILEKTCFSSYETTLFRAAYSLAFFGLFRAGELVWTSPGEPDRHLQTTDIQFIRISNKLHCLKVQLRKSKTNQAGKPEIVTVHPVKSAVCPIQAMFTYLSVKPKLSTHLFCHENGSPLTRYQFGAVISKSLINFGMSPVGYKTHSFRIGAATWLAQQGISYDKIKKLGRWSSNAFVHYIRI